MTEGGDRRRGLRRSIEETLQVRRATLRCLLVALAAYLAGNLLMVLLVFPQGGLQALASITAGLVSATLIANLAIFGGVALVLWRCAGLSASDLGLQARGLGIAVTIAAVLWCVANLVQIGVAIADHAPPLVVDPAWTDGSILRRIGGLLGQLFGNALLEEVLFRAVLFRQLYHLLASKVGFAWALVLALLVSQAIFALIHLPLLVHAGLAAGDAPATLLQLFTLGTLLALAYLRSGNLPLVIGIHALSNAPTSLVVERTDLAGPGWLAAGASMLVIVLWPITDPSRAETPAMRSQGTRL